MECILWPSQVMGRLGYICFCMGLITQWTIRSSLITGGEGSETYPFSGLNGDVLQNRVWFSGS